MKDRIYIGGMEYEIKIVKHLAIDNNSLGTFSGNIATICIEGTIPDRVKRKVLLHEILEAINYEYELKIDHNKICVLETALHQVLQDNIWFSELFKKRG